MSQPDSISRRDALKRFVLMCGAASALPAIAAQAAELPHLSPDDPTAKALGYHEEAKTVEPKKYPTYVAGQMCSNCQQLQGTAGEAYRPCNIFAGRVVNANGWCQVWVKKA
jgi:hypothetical protein